MRHPIPAVYSRRVRRPISSSVVGALVSLISLGAVAWWISRQEAPQLPDSPSGYALLVLALALAAGNFCLRSWRWHRIMRQSAVAHRGHDALGLTLVGYMGNNVLPARGGELLKIGLLGQRTDARRRDILGTVVVERALDAGVLAVLFVALSYAGVRGAAGGTGATITAAALVLAVAVLGGYLWLRRRGRFERFAALVRPVAASARAVLARGGVPLVVVSLVIWWIDGLTFMIIARAVGAQLALVPALAVVVLASLAAAIPAAPGYVGTFDAGILVGLHAAGVEGGDAVGVLLLARFMFFVPVTLVGLGVLVLGYGGLRGLSLRRRTAEP
jgi:glycosyltransferase 2 family protein